jgi:hypothetical protein
MLGSGEGNRIETSADENVHGVNPLHVGGTRVNLAGGWL